MAKAEVRQSSHLLLDLKTPEYPLRHNHAPHFHRLVEGGAVGFLSLPNVDALLFHASPPCRTNVGGGALNPPSLPSQETHAYVLHGILETVLRQKAGEMGTHAA